MTSGETLKTTHRGRRDSGEVPDSSSVAAAEAKLAFLDALLPQIARAIGPVCEIVLHEIAAENVTIRTIANGHISNRRPGGPMGRIFVADQEVDRFGEAIFNYTGRTQDGKSLRCSLIPVQHQGETIGLICVNFLTSDLAVARDAIAALLRVEPQAESVSEYVPGEPDLFEQILQNCVHERGRPLQRLSRDERLVLLTDLKARGALRVRGAADRLAACLGISRTTIYNDLREIN